MLKYVNLFFLLCFIVIFHVFHESFKKRRLMSLNQQISYMETNWIRCSLSNCNVMKIVKMSNHKIANMKLAFVWSVKTAWANITIVCAMWTWKPLWIWMQIAIHFITWKKCRADSFVSKFSNLKKLKYCFQTLHLPVCILYYECQGFILQCQKIYRGIHDIPCALRFSIAKPHWNCSETK